MVYYGREEELRKGLIEVGRMMYQKDFVAGTDGNITARVGADRILCTRSGVNKGLLRDWDILLIDMDGRLLRGTGRVTTEVRMHITAYREREDIQAAIHAHPPLATAFSIAGISLARCILPEVVMTLREIPTTKYAMPSSPEGGEVIRDLIRCYDAILLDRHGTFTVGKSLMDAYNKLEKIEHTARITLAARQLGRVRELTREEVDNLIALSRQLGIDLPTDRCMECGACVLSEGPVEPEMEKGALLNIITGEVLKEIKKA